MSGEVEARLLLVSSRIPLEGDWCPTEIGPGPADGSQIDRRPSLWNTVPLCVCSPLSSLVTHNISLGWDRPSRQKKKKRIIAMGQGISGQAL